MIRKSTSKKSTAIKICGITTTSQAKSIAQFKINAIGVIGVKNSPRFVAEEECIRIFNEVANAEPSKENQVEDWDQIIEAKLFLKNLKN